MSANPPSTRTSGLITIVHTPDPSALPINLRARTAYRNTGNELQHPLRWC
jgi:hypothetical protein